MNGFEFTCVVWGRKIYFGGSKIIFWGVYGGFLVLGVELQLCGNDEN